MRECVGRETTNCLNILQRQTVTRFTLSGTGQIGEEINLCLLGLDRLLGGTSVIVDVLLDSQTGQLLGEGLTVPSHNVQVKKKSVKESSSQKI